MVLVGLVLCNVIIGSGTKGIGIPTGVETTGIGTGSGIVVGAVFGVLVGGIGASGPGTSGGCAASGGFSVGTHIGVSGETVVTSGGTRNIYGGIICP